MPSTTTRFDTFGDPTYGAAPSGTDYGPFVGPYQSGADGSSSMGSGGINWGGVAKNLGPLVASAFGPGNPAKDAALPAAKDLQAAGQNTFAQGQNTSALGTNSIQGV